LAIGTENSAKAIGLHYRPKATLEEVNGENRKVDLRRTDPAGDRHDRTMDVNLVGDLAATVVPQLN